MLFILGAEGSRYGGLYPETGASAVKEDLHTADLQRPKPHPRVATRLSNLPSSDSVLHQNTQGHHNHFINLSSTLFFYG